MSSLPEELGMPDEDPVVAQRRISLELKYAAIAVALLGVVVIVHAVDALSGVNSTLTNSVDAAASFGAFGLFLIALVANASVIIQIPYTLPLLSAALDRAGLQHMLLLGSASGLGAGIGAIMGYRIATVITGKDPALPDSRLFRWIARNVDRRPRSTKLAIYLLAASPIPDGTIVLPLAVVNYGMRRISAPLFLGKLTHNVLLSWLFYMFASWSAKHVSTKASADLALVVAALFVVLVCYHAEKASFIGSRRRRHPAPSDDA